MTNPLAYKNRGKGDRYEYKTRDILENDGYYVIRAGGSLGKFDFLAFKVGSFLKLIQIKSFKPNKEQKKKIKAGYPINLLFYAQKKIIADLETFEAPFYAVKELWTWYYFKKDPEIKEIP